MMKGRSQIFTILFIAIFAVLLILPNFKTIGIFNGSKINLGLDLQGGSDILLQVKVQDYIKNFEINLTKQIQEGLYAKKIGYKNFQNNNGISFTLRNIQDLSLAKKVLKKLDVTFKEEGGEFSITLSEQKISQIKQKVLEQSIEVIRKRVDELGNKEIAIAGVEEDRISLQVPGSSSSDEIKKLLNTQAKLTFHLMDDRPFVEKTTPQKEGVMFLEGKEGEGYYYAVLKNVIIDGADLEDASATFTESGEPAVSFQFNNYAGQTFGEVTMQNIGRPFAIVLDNKVLSAPNIKEPILSGSGIISGSFTTKEANELSLLLRAGALPAEIEVLSHQKISATLGRDSVILGVKSLIAGMLLVCIFILARYRVFGGVAIFSLIVNILLLLAFLSAFNSTLTLPGIAGIILTIGMAVDGNIIIFENIKSYRGKFSNEEATFKALSNATTSIVDANLTTIIGGLVLYQFGFGAIRGFALTLILGTLFSMFSCLFITKTLLTFNKNKALLAKV